MAKIPQPFANVSASTGSILSEAPMGAFGNSGLSSIASGLQDLGRGIQINSKLRKEIEEKEKQRKDTMWVNQAISNYNRGLTDFEVDPQNQGRTDYLPSFLSKAESDSETFAKEAPSPEALEKFNEHARTTVDSRYARTASKQANNELLMDITQLDSSWGQSLSSYHQLSSSDAEGAAIDLQINLANNAEAIMELYGGVSLDVARKRVAKRIEETAMALADKNPEQARELTIESPFLEEQARQVLLNKIDAKKQEGSLLLKEDFNTAREKVIIRSQKEGVRSDLPLSDYQAVFPGEQAEVMKKRDDAIMASYESAHRFVSSVKGELPGIKAQKATELEQSLETENELKAFANVIQPALVRDQRLFEDDSVQWLSENNEQVQLIAKELTALEESGSNTGADGLPGVLPNIEEGPVVADPALSAGLREQYYSALLRYQGFPTEGSDPTKFMNRPPGQRTILTKKQANYYSNQINSGTIDDAVNTIRGILNQYPNDELRAHAIADLTTLPQEKIKPEYQVAFQNADQSWLPDYLGAIKGAGDLASMSVIDNAKLKVAVSSNPSWNSFLKSTSGPQGQRSAELAGYFNAVETYAKAKVIKNGVTPAKAAEEAVAQLLKSTMAPVQIRGTSGIFSGGSNQELWLPREMFGKIHSDEELANYGRRMGMAVTAIHPDDVDPNQFPAYSIQSDPEKRRRLIRQQIKETAQYYPDPGGLTYRLTVKSSVDGSQVDLRTKDGKLFQLPLDRVPIYAKRDSNGTLRDDNVPPFDPKKAVNGFMPTGHFWNFTQ